MMAEDAAAAESPTALGRALVERAPEERPVWFRTHCEGLAARGAPTAPDLEAAWLASEFYTFAGNTGAPTGFATIPQGQHQCPVSRAQPRPPAIGADVRTV
jgi:hypothetical protein